MTGQPKIASLEEFRAQALAHPVAGRLASERIHRLEIDIYNELRSAMKLAPPKFSKLTKR